VYSVAWIRLTALQHAALAVSLVVALLAPGCEGEGSAPGIVPVFRQNFDSHPDGQYSAAALAGDWNNPAWSRGISEGRVSIVSGSGAYMGKSLQIRCPKGRVGPEGGAAWPVSLRNRYPVLLLSYRFRFSPEFDFVRGGKLPGLAGGRANDGGNRPTGRDGWSARIVWNAGGQLAAYVYHPDQPSSFGEILDFSGRARPGRWHHVVMRVTMNTPGRNDGGIECWLDGNSVLNHGNMRFRDTPELGIDMVLFSTFFGGSDATWGPRKDETISLDDFIVGQ